MGVLDDLSGPAQKCSALFLHLGQKQQVVLECVLQVSKLGTVATASS